MAIALGSNLGDRDAHLDYAVRHLCGQLAGCTVSSRYDTAPVDVVGEQGRFLNAALVGLTTLTPEALLDVLERLEQERGRERPYLNAPRTLDLDLVVYGDLVVETGRLTLPHPRFRDRLFVLEPLAEIAPDVIDPVTGLSIAVLLRNLVSRRRR